MQPRVTLQLPDRPLTGRSSALAGASVLLIGNGFVARALRPVLEREGAIVRHTVRQPFDHADAVVFGSDAMRRAFSAADAVVVSIPPARDGGEPTFAALDGARCGARWIGYLSATSVYGDRSGNWAFEGEAPTPGLARGRRRADAEIAWLSRYPQSHIFRLAGIYGPGRSPFAKLRDGAARVVRTAESHVVNRIHMDDIVSALVRSMQRPSPQDIYNIADGHPARPGAVLDYAAELLGVPEPPRVDLDAPSISAMARSFYSESKRIDVSRAREQMGWTPRFATYREGLADVLTREPYGLAE